MSNIDYLFDLYNKMYDSNISERKFSKMINRIFKSEIKKNVFIDNCINYKNNVLGDKILEISMIYTKEEMNIFNSKIVDNIDYDNIETIDDLVKSMRRIDNVIRKINIEIKNRKKVNSIISELSKLYDELSKESFDEEKNEVEKWILNFKNVRTYNDFKNLKNDFVIFYNELINNLNDKANRKYVSEDIENSNEENINSIDNNKIEDNNNIENTEIDENEKVENTKMDENEKVDNNIKEFKNEEDELYLIKPLLYFEKLKLMVIQNKELDDEQAIEMYDYVENLRLEFIYLFKTTLDYNNKDVIKRMLNSADSLVLKRLENYSSQKVKKIA